MKPGDKHIHVGVGDPLPAQLGRWQIDGGEVRHVDDRVTGPANRRSALRRTDFGAGNSRNSLGSVSS
jgi:hypothetical protein